MRSIAVVLLAGLLAACGDDNDNDDGGGGGGGSVTIAGSSTLNATLSNASALNVAGTCDVDTGVGIITSGFATAIVGVSTAANLCTDLQQGREAANATTVGVVVVRQNLGGGSETIGPGTYPVWDLTGLPPITGTSAVYAIVTASRSGGPQAGECAVAAEATALGGSVTITSVSGSAIAGTIQGVTFDATEGGGSVSGTFNAPTCPIAVSIDPTTCLPTGLPVVNTCG